MLTFYSFILLKEKVKIAYSGFTFYSFIVLKEHSLQVL